jgi:hypothetical protein
LGVGDAGFPSVQRVRAEVIGNEDHNVRLFSHVNVPPYRDLARAEAKHRSFPLSKACPAIFMFVSVEINGHIC